MVGNMKLLQIAYLLRTLVHFLAHIVERHAAFVHHHHHVIEHVVDLADQLGLIPVFGGNDGFCALLSNLLEDLVQPALKQIAGV